MPPSKKRRRTLSDFEIFLTNTTLFWIAENLSIRHVAKISRGSRQLRQTACLELRQREGTTSFMGIATLVYKPGRALPNPIMMRLMLFMAMNKKACWFRAIDLIKTIRSIIRKRVDTLSEVGGERRYMRLITQVACAFHAVCEKEPKAVMETGGMTAIMEIMSVVMKMLTEDRLEFLVFSLDRLASGCLLLLRRCGEDCDSMGVERIKFAKQGAPILIKALLHSGDTRLQDHGCVIITRLLERGEEIEKTMAMHLLKKGIYDILINTCRHRLAPSCISVISCLATKARPKVNTGIVIQNVNDPL